MTEQLTREQLLAMEPGRELDALVAEKVMGWQECGIEGLRNKLAYGKPPHFDDGDPRVRIYEYSTDISAAWEVLRQTKMIVHIEGHFHTGWAVTLDDKFIALDWELPVAICKAALLAVMGL